VLQASALNRILAFDADSGVLRCEAGITLGDILSFCLPRGWVLPVVPGTCFVTVGGAIANDIHGKNHHHAGTFGCHVRSFLLQRTDGECLHCTAEENADWYTATIGGLGLTGVLLEAELQLNPVAGCWLATENIRFESLEDFFELSSASDADYEYTVAWIDCLSKRTRGHFSRANHSERTDAAEQAGPILDIPFALPVTPFNRWSLSVFNSLYYHRQRRIQVASDRSFSRWMFPLDRIGHWNRLYGRRGFRQFQCVVNPEAVAELLRVIRRAGEGSFLAVLKMFGSVSSPGLLSFPRAGATLALDFPWRGAPTQALFRELDAVVASANGAIYPAKDALMSGADFRRAYPAWQSLENFRDPGLKSLFWQRVTEEE
jgi:FAD/FMN-containing dehydrogenase